MKNEEKTLQLLLENLTAQLGRQAYRIAELETVVALKSAEIEELEKKLPKKD